MILPLFEFIFRVKALQYVYAYMDVGDRATQEQLPSSPVCPSRYVRRGAGMHRLLSEGCKKLQSPSLDFALRASVASRHCSQICLEQIWAHALLSKSEVHGCTSSKFAPGNFVTKGTAISSFFRYANQANTTAWTQDDSREGGGRECLEHILEVERIRMTESRMTLQAVQLRILG